MNNEVLQPLSAGVAFCALLLTPIPVAAAQSNAELSAFVDSIAAQAHTHIAAHAPSSGSSIKLAVFPPMRTSETKKCLSSLFAEDIVEAIVRQAPTGVTSLAGGRLVQALRDEFISPAAYRQASDAANLASYLPVDVFVSGTIVREEADWIVRVLVASTADGVKRDEFRVPVPRGLERWLLRRLKDRGSDARDAFGDQDGIEPIIFDDAARNVLLRRRLAHLVDEFARAIEPMADAGSAPRRIGIMPVWRQDTDGYSQFSEILHKVLGDRFSGAMHAPTIGKRLFDLQPARSLNWYTSDLLEPWTLTETGLDALVQAYYQQVDGGGLRVVLRWNPYSSGGTAFEMSEHFADARIEGYVADLMKAPSSSNYKFQDVEIDDKAELQLALEKAALDLAATVQSGLEENAAIYVVPVLTPATAAARAALEQLWGELDMEQRRLTELANEEGLDLEKVMNERKIWIAGDEFESYRAAEQTVMAKLESSLAMMKSGRIEKHLASQLNDALRVKNAFPRNRLQLSERSMTGGGAGHRDIRNRGNSPKQAPKAFSLSSSRYWILPSIEHVGDHGLRIVVEMLDNETYEEVKGGIIVRDVPHKIAKLVRASLSKFDMQMPEDFLQPFRTAAAEHNDGTAERPVGVDEADKSKTTGTAFGLAGVHCIHWTPGARGSALAKRIRAAKELSTMVQGQRGAQVDPIALGVPLQSECELLYDPKRPGAQKAAERLRAALVGDHGPFLGADQHELIRDLDPLTRSIGDFPESIQADLRKDLAAGGSAATVLLVITR